MTEETTETATPTDYQSALTVLDACNLSGVVYSLARVLPRIWAEAREGGKGTTEVNQHPIVCLYVAQMVALTYGITVPDEAFHAAYQACKEGTACK